MAKIRPLDMRLLDDLFGIPSGYVLDFSNRTFAEFFKHEVGIDIYASKYAYGSGSKGKRLRSFLDVEPEALVARALRSLWEYREIGRGPSAANDDLEKRNAARFFQLVHSMDGNGGPVPMAVTDAVPVYVAPPAHVSAELNGRLLGLANLTNADSPSRDFSPTCSTYIRSHRVARSG